MVEMSMGKYESHWLTYYETIKNTINSEVINENAEESLFVDVPHFPSTNLFIGFPPEHIQPFIPVVFIFQ